MSCAALSLLQAALHDERQLSGREREVTPPRHQGALASDRGRSSSSDCGLPSLRMRRRNGACFELEPPRSSY